MTEPVRVTWDMIRQIEAWVAQWDKLSQAEKHRWEMRVDVGAQKRAEAEASFTPPVDRTCGTRYNGITDQ